MLSKEFASVIYVHVCVC